MMKILSYLMFTCGTGSLALGAYYFLKLAQGAGGLAGILPLVILVAFSVIGVVFFFGIGFVLLLISKRKKQSTKQND